MVCCRPSFANRCTEEQYILRYRANDLKISIFRSQNRIPECGPPGLQCWHFQRGSDRIFVTPEPPVTHGKEAFGLRIVLLVSACLWDSLLILRGLIVAVAMLVSFIIVRTPGCRSVDRMQLPGGSIIYLMCHGSGHLSSDSICASGVATDGRLIALGSEPFLTHRFLVAGSL